MGITRAAVLERSVNGWPKQGVSYSQSLIWVDADGRTDDDGWRQDCSGYVSMCWLEAKSGDGNWGGWSTVTFVTHGRMVEIPRDQLRPGDAIGLCGPGTAGDDGHIMLYIGRSGSGWTIREQAGGGKGWRERTLYSWPSGYKAWRCVNVVEDDGTSLPAGPVSVPTYDLPQYVLGSRVLTQGAYGTDVYDLQVALNLHGATPQLAMDGEYGPATAGAVVAFQRQYRLEVDGEAGPQTIGKLRELPVDASTWTLPAGHYYGPADGPDESHGGAPGYESDRPQVQAIQRQLVALGYAGQVDPNDWADGVWEDPTTQAVRAWQTATGRAVTGVVRQDDWRALFTPPAPAQPPTPADPPATPEPPASDPTPQPQPDPAPATGDAPAEGTAAALKAAVAGRNPATINVVRHFAWAHLPANLQDVSRPIGTLALQMVAALPDGPDLTVGLRQLLEAKDSLVRAALPD